MAMSKITKLEFGISFDDFDCTSMYVHKAALINK